MLKIARVILKDFKLLIRSRSSAVVVLLGPLLLMLLVGLAFNTSNLFDIKVATYSSAYNELSDSLIANLEDNSYKVFKIDNEQECINSVERGRNHVCAVIPGDLDVQNTEGAIVFYVDKTRVNIAGAIINSLSTKISLKSSEISTSLTNTLLTSLNDASVKLNEKKDAIRNLTSNLVTTENRLISLESSTGELNTSYGVNISDYGDQLDDIKSGNNLTGDTAEDISKFASSFKGLLRNLEDRFDEIQDFKDTTNTEVSSIKSVISSDKEIITEVEKIILEITEDIDKIEIKDVSKIVNPITTEIKPIVAEKTHLGNTFPSLLVLVLLFSGILLGSTMIINEKSSPAYFRNFITPTKDVVFVIGNYFSNLIILLLQLTVIFVVMMIITKAVIEYQVISNLYVALFLIASVFILIGTLIGYIFKSSETANLASMSASAILLFFSNTILPIETLPTGIRQIVQYSPFVLGENVLRKILIFNESLAEAIIPLSILLGYVIVLFVIVYVLRKGTKRRV
ncbi:hypothetical protein CL617_01335 [archaeon]|nr:hypothetical protein [archaeon]|tara:strand:- start:9869 stop:11407 length:1539 start_codon:yes stop_codon:yes gene_type:complete